ncbi:Beta-mannosidase B [Psilocybe cubensis]|uniref:Beta-mannosidase B n=1 Tax=Psilocybe cubensis TaxID=181762 RepID=A0ACB8H7B3_PSICU|nr:Beta-mannosidase B [Psilocybe cubensis]KAH9483065.1 Beta-mannosidase B [Psilocybe cubensis]
MTASSKSRPISDWLFTQVQQGATERKVKEWLQVSSFPTTVHVELIKQKLIPDPFIGLHEWDVQWVGEAEWAFKTDLHVTDGELASPNVDLLFEGLDTFATVKLNDEVILESSNQFISYRVPVKSKLKPGSNELIISFESAFRKGRAIEEEHGKLALWNGDSSRLHVRKAQYNYGWDWGPVLMTVGPWKPIALETYQTRITDLDVRSEVSETLEVKLSATLTFSEESPGFASFVLKSPDGKVEASSNKIPIVTGHAKVSFEWGAGQLQLWYPVGYGAQPLYTVEVELTDANGNVLDSKLEKIAFRRALVVQEKLIDQEGLSFLFEINNIRIFCGGSNWIPADSFLTTMNADRYRAWLQLLVDGNQNMIRVWGGGIYEYDDFYSICDVLVWQDFMFGCGQYPAYDSFVESVREEAIQNVKRLRHHPSIVIFDYQIAESLNLELDYSDETSDFRKTNFPARYIYERVLPSVVGEYSNIHYHRASPYSGQGKPTTDRTLGDLHQWNVWHGTQEPWHNWDILAGRFVSEFGMQGYPDIRTVDYWLGGDKSERYPQSRTNNNHNKADGFERRLEVRVSLFFLGGGEESQLRAVDTLDVKRERICSLAASCYVYYTQIMQAEVLASAYRLWRRNWAGRGREYTAGALVWQINDCWPVTSWAIVDYFLRPKPAYFSVARELRPYTVGMTRKEKQTLLDPTRSAAEFTLTTELEVWGTNSTLADKSAVLEVTCFNLDLDSEDSTWRESRSREVRGVVLRANASTELWKGVLPGQPERRSRAEVPKPIVVSARLLDAEDHGTVLCRYSNWPEPFKYIHFPPVDALGLKAVVGTDGESVVLSTRIPVKGIVLDVDVDAGDKVRWSDQAIDLVPDDPQTVIAKGLKGRPVKMRFLGDGSA